MPKLVSTDMEKCSKKSQIDSEAAGYDFDEEPVYNQAGEGRAANRQKVGERNPGYDRKIREMSSNV